MVVRTTCAAPTRLNETTGALGCGVANLAAEAVEGASLALEGVDDIHGSDGLAASVLGVGDGITDDVLEEHLEDRAGLLVDEARDTLHTTTASETADSGLGDSLDVVTKDLPVALSAALAETLTALSTSRHVQVLCEAQISKSTLFVHPKRVPLDIAVNISLRVLRFSGDTIQKRDFNASSVHGGINSRAPQISEIVNFPMPAVNRTRSRSPTVPYFFKCHKSTVSGWSTLPTVKPKTCTV